MKHFWLPALALAAVLAGCGGGGGGGESEASHPTAEPAAQVEKNRDSEKDGSKTQLKTAWIAMDGWDSPETVGFGMAEKGGYFTNIGLSVLTLSPPTPKVTISDVVRGIDAVGVAHEPEVVLAKAKGAPILILSSLIPQPTASLIWLKRSQIDGIAGLRGKTIAIPGLSFQRDFLETVLARGGLSLDDVKIESVGNDLVPALTSGRADAIFGGSWNLEGVELKARGLDPVVSRVQDLGIPPYDELVLISRSDVPAEPFESMQELAAAVARGGVDAGEHPDEAVEALVAGGEANPEISRKVMRAELEATIPLLSAPAETDAGQLEGLIGWMHEQGMIQQSLPAAELIAK